MRRLIKGAFLILILCSTFVFFNNVHASTFQEWQIENGGGTYSESNGIISLSGGAGNKNIAFYKQIAPTTDFTFSLQVKSTALMGFAIYLRSSLPLANSVNGVNFQFGEKEGGSFLLARWTNVWTWDVFASAQENVWYTMIIAVQQTPFKITAQVLAENGTSLGSYSASDMTNLSFEGIKYLGFGVWESGTYSVRNIQSSLEPYGFVDDFQGQSLDGGWSVENLSSKYSLSEGILTLSSNAGANTGLALYKYFMPQTDNFTVSARIKASVLDFVALRIQFKSLPIILPGAAITCATLQVRQDRFLAVITSTELQIYAPTATGVWYILKMEVQKNPFKIVFNVYNDGGTLLGTQTITVNGFSYADIHYISLQLWNTGLNPVYEIDWLKIWTGSLEPPTPSPTASPMPTPTPTLIPTPTSSATPTPTSTPTPTPTKPSASLALSCSSSTSYTAFKVEITGKLSANRTGLSGVPVSISYSITGGNSWQDLTLVNTGSDGSFSAVWTPSVTGNYMIKAAWDGNADYSSASTTVNLAVAPFEDENAQNVFSVASNSTISDLAFNSTSRQFTFTVAGPSGTTGYVDAHVAKTLIDDITKVSVYLDGNAIESTATSTADSWLLHFTYEHSTHEVTLSLGSENQQTFIETPFGLYAIVGAIAIIIIVLAVIVLKRRKTSKQK